MKKLLVKPCLSRGLDAEMHQSQNTTMKPVGRKGRPFDGAIAPLTSEGIPSTARERWKRRQGSLCKSPLFVTPVGGRTCRLSDDGVSKDRIQKCKKRLDNENESPSGTVRKGLIAERKLRCQPLKEIWQMTTKTVRRDRRTSGLPTSH